MDNAGHANTMPDTKHRVAGRLRHITVLIALVVFTTAGALALYYSTITPSALRCGLAACFAGAMVACYVARHTYPARLCLAGLSLSFCVWYVTDPPKNNRNWAGEYKVLADAGVNGRIVHLKHIRNFIYKTEQDYIPRYYDADFNLDRLDGVDLITSYWAGDNIAHVFLSFSFKGGQHLAVSIETRRQETFPYSTIAGFFHHYELIYVTADERDLIGVRTDIRRERVYLYRLKLTPAVSERLFLSYVNEIHSLNSRPQWYNTLTDNCTTGILARAGARLRYRLDWRVLLSGHTASLAYDLGLLDNTMTFPALRDQSRIRRKSGAVPGPDYSEEIRRHTAE